MNRRLLNGERGDRILEWLNGLPETKALMAAQFGCEPVKKQNLHKWVRGGYKEWLAEQEKFAFFQHLTEIPDAKKAAAAATSMDKMVGWAAARLYLALQRLATGNNIKSRSVWKTVLEASEVLLAIRNSDQREGRLQIAHEQLELGYHRLKLQRQIAGMKQAHVSWEIVSGPKHKLKLRGCAYTVEEMNRLYKKMTEM